LNEANAMKTPKGLVLPAPEPEVFAVGDRVMRRALLGLGAGEVVEVIAYANGTAHYLVRWPDDAVHDVPGGYLAHA
jgi:hypothetical protein